MLTVAIIGAGPLGRWLGLSSARAGFHVLLEDVMPANLHHAQEYIRRQVSATDFGDGTLPIRFVATIEEAVRDADLAIDCVPDELESKLEILFLLDRMAPPRTVLATPTTRLSIADLASCTYRSDRCVGIAADPRSLAGMAPSDIRIQTTALTREDTVEVVRRFWQGLGFTPAFELDPSRPDTPRPDTPKPDPPEPEPGTVPAANNQPA